MNITKYLFNHTSEETAYTVDGYPWGFRLKTQQRYWIETVRNKGDRFCTRTLNPKTGKWCAVKKSTYSEVMAMILHEEDGIEKTSFVQVSTWSKPEQVEEFKNTIGPENLNPEQIRQLKRVLAINKVMENVTFTIKASAPIDLFDRSPENLAKLDQAEKEQEAHKIQEAEPLKRINNAINYELGQMQF